MKRRTLAGNCGVAVFAIAFVCIVVAFSTPSWLVSDYRITGAKLDRLGLWVHCFRSLPDVNDDYQRRFFVGCRWVYDPFTTGYDEIRGFLIPRKFNEPKRMPLITYDFVSAAFMIITQFFMTLAFIAIFVSLILVMLYFLCGGPDQKYFLLMIKVSKFDTNLFNGSTFRKSLISGHGVSSARSRRLCWPRRDNFCMLRESR